MRGLLNYITIGCNCVTWQINDITMQIYDFWEVPTFWPETSYNINICNHFERCIFICPNYNKPSACWALVSANWHSTLSGINSIIIVFLRRGGNQYNLSESITGKASYSIIQSESQWHNNNKIHLKVVK